MLERALFAIAVLTLSAACGGEVSRSAADGGSGGLVSGGAGGASGMSGSSGTQAGGLLQCRWWLPVRWWMRERNLRGCARGRRMLELHWLLRGGLRGAFHLQLRQLVLEPKRARLVPADDALALTASRRRVLEDFASAGLVSKAELWIKVRFATRTERLRDAPASSGRIVIYSIFEPNAFLASSRV
jgi:hypothetical protein